MRLVAIVSLLLIPAAWSQAQERTPAASRADLAELLSRLNNTDTEKLKLGIELLKQTNEALVRYERLREDLRGLSEALPLRFRAGGIAFGFAESRRLGVQLERPSATLLHQLDLAEGFALVVTHVAENSPAATAGIRRYDILLQFAGQNVPSDAVEFERQLASIKTGMPIAITVLRRGQEQRLTLDSLPPVSQQPGPAIEIDFFGSILNGRR